MMILKSYVFPALLLSLNITSVIPTTRDQKSGLRSLHMKNGEQFRFEEKNRELQWITTTNGDSNTIDHVENEIQPGIHPPLKTENLSISTKTPVVSHASSSPTISAPRNTPSVGNRDQASEDNATMAKKKKGKKSKSQTPLRRRLTERRLTERRLTERKVKKAKNKRRER
eukprot:scaffold1698_cov279-Chaetoceros_neogracile.AAC.8